MIHRFLLAVLLLAWAVTGRAEDTANVRVVFWNMEWFPGGHPNATTTEAAAQIVKSVPVLGKLNPDITGLTEILNSDAVEIANYQVPDSKPVVCSGFLDETGAITLQQIAIASKLPATSAWWEDWKPGPVTPKRGFSFAAFTPAPGHVLLVYTVHLKSNRGDAKENFPMREESTRQILSHVKAMEQAYAKMGKVGVIIGGDFNTSMDDPKFKDEGTLRDLVKAGFKWCWEGIPFEDRVTLPTAPSKNPNFPPFPDACFDHAFTKNLTVSEASVAISPDGTSDHRPIIIDLSYPAASAQE